MRTVSLELAKQLKETGYPQTGCCWYRKLNKDDGYAFYDIPWDGTCWDEVVSPTADELYEVLPVLTTTIKRKTGEYHISLVIQYGDSGRGHYEQADILPDALAKMLIWLMDNKPSGLIFK